jgi:hypothetical protein
MRKHIAPCSVNATARVTISASGGPGKKMENNAEIKKPTHPSKLMKTTHHETLLGCQPQ